MVVRLAEVGGGDLAPDARPFALRASPLDGLGFEAREHDRHGGVRVRFEQRENFGAALAIGALQCASLEHRQRLHAHATRRLRSGEKKRQN